MNVSEMVSTLLGGFLISFFILLVWGRLVNRLHMLGGLLAAILLIGNAWFLNHGMDTPLIRQTGLIFVDMGFATAIGTFAYGVFQKKEIRPSLHNLLAALMGGSLAGWLSFLMFFR